MEVLGGSGVGIMDLNDALISNGIPPRDPVAGALWIDTSTGKSVLKVYINNKWETQKLDVSKLDPDLATKLQGVIDTLGTIANDGVLTFSDRVTLSKELGEILGTLPSKSTGNVYPSALPDYTVLDASGSGTFANMRLRATDVGIATDTAWYKDVETAYKALNTFLSAFTPKPWDITTANKAINVVIATPDVFRQRFLDYYMAELRLATETEKQAKIKAEEYAEKLTDGSSVVDKTETLSGNPVSTDKSDDAVVHVGVDGKSEQISASGNYNILNTSIPENEMLSKAEVITSYSKESDSDAIYGEVSKYVLTGFTGTNTGANARGLYLGATNKGLKVSDLAVGDILTFSFSMKSSRNLKLRCFANSLENVTSSALNTTTNWQEFSYTFRVADLNGINNIHMFANGEVWQVGDVQYFHSMKLEKGSTATPIPIPSPDYPSTINSLDKSFDIVSSVSGRNLVPNSGGNPQSLKGWTAGSGGEMSIDKHSFWRESKENMFLLHNRATTVQEATVSSDRFFIQPSTEYTFSFWVFHDSNLIDFDVYVLGRAKGETAGYTITISKMGNTVSTGASTLFTWTFNTPSNIESAVLRIDHNGRKNLSSGSTLYFTNSKLEKGNKATDWTPAVEGITYNTQSPIIYKTNILLSEPLRGVGDVKDRLFLDTDGLWKVERNVGEVTLDGTQSFGLNTTVQDNFQFIYSISGGASGSATDLNSSHFKVVRSDSTSGTSWIYDKKTLVINMPRRLATTVTEMSSWLKQNPVTNQYKLVIPVIETLSAEQQTKLNNIQSFKGNNYVYTVANVTPNLNATFKAKAWYRNFSIQRDLTEVNDVANSLKNFTDTAFADGIIERAEAKAIAEHLNTLKKENDDLSNQYNGIYANTSLIGAFKTNLYNSKVAYNTAYSNLTTAVNTAIAGNKTTTAQKTDVDAKFTAYSGALKLLTQRMNEALTAISGKQATDAVDGINIGGVNLLLNSKSNGNIAEKYGDFSVMRGVAPSTGTVDTYAFRTPVLTDLEYTVSFFAKSSTASSFMNYFYSPNTTISGITSSGNTSTGSDGGIGLSVTTEWKRYWITWKQSASGSAKSVIIGRVSPSKDVFIAGVKFEAGNKASNWTEAPEDIQEDINKKTGAPVRYIRDWLNGSTANLGNHWVALQAKALDGTDRARGILPTSDSLLTNPAYLTSGNTASDPYVSGVDTGVLQYVQVDLGKVYYDIADISVWHYHRDGRAYNNTKTEISVDGTNWEPLYDSLTQGTYPETAEGNILPTTIVDRMRIITSRVALAEQVITPEAITGTVMSQETFVEWKENVDTKANGEDVDNLMLEMGNVQDTLNGTDSTEGIITKMSTVEQKADSWTADISELKEVTGVQGTVTEQVTAYMEFKMTGLEIGKSDSDMKVNISNSQIDFMDKGVSVAYINGQKMFITQVEITESLIIGNHKIEKLDGNSDITIVSWVGQGG